MLRIQPTSLANTEAPGLPDSEVIRKRFLNHEASIQAIGGLYLLGCVVLTGLGIAGLLGYNRFEPGNPRPSYLTSALFLAFAAAEGWIGWHLRKLDPRAKIPATLMAILGLLAFPIGTLINAYVLYLLHSAKGKYVFSPEYRAVINTTPQIRYKMSIIVWIFIWLLLGFMALAVFGALFGKR